MHPHIIRSYLASWQMTSHKADSSGAQVGRFRINTYIYIYMQRQGGALAAGSTEFKLVRFDVAVDDAVGRLRCRSCRWISRSKLGVHCGLTSRNDLVHALQRLTAHVGWPPWWVHQLAAQWALFPTVLLFIFSVIFHDSPVPASQITTFGLLIFLL
jgi:hypothetical protein